MVQLIDSDIQTREVLDWKGLHLLHFVGSSCSKKVRIFLNLKGVDWESHPIDLMGSGNYDEWFLGINPRGLVPVLVDDGKVHIESNDILLHLEEKLPQPSLIPTGKRSELEALLKLEDELHLDIRTLTFRFFIVIDGPPKPPGALESYRDTGSGTVQGQQDPEKKVQIDFWETVARDGITDAAARSSALRFKQELTKLDVTLSDNSYLLGDSLSVLDIAWFIYVDRLMLTGYPVATLHSNVAQWFQKLCKRPEFMQEIEMPDSARKAVAARHREQEEKGMSLSQVAGF